MTYIQYKLYGVARFLPLTWVIYLLYKVNYLKRDYQGCFRCDPNILSINRLLFHFKPILGKTNKNTKFVGDWKWTNLWFWEIHRLNLDTYPKNTETEIPFP